MIRPQHKHLALVLAVVAALFLLAVIAAKEGLTP